MIYVGEIKNQIYPIFQWEGRGFLKLNSVIVIWKSSGSVVEKGAKFEVVKSMDRGLKKASPEGLCQ